MKQSTALRAYTGDNNKFVWLTSFTREIPRVMLTMRKKYEAINPAMLVTYGVPIFLSGIFLKFKPLITRRILCRLFAMTSTFYWFRISITSHSLFQLYAGNGARLSFTRKIDMKEKHPGLIRDTLFDRNIAKCNDGL